MLENHLYYFDNNAIRAVNFNFVEFFSIEIDFTKNELVLCLRTNSLDSRNIFIKDIIHDSSIDTNKDIYRTIRIMCKDIIKKHNTNIPSWMEFTSSF